MLCHVFAESRIKIWNRFRCNQKLVEFIILGYLPGQELRHKEPLTHAAQAYVHVSYTLCFIWSCV